MFPPFFCPCVINFYLPAVAPVPFSRTGGFGTILYGVELFLIFISHNDYGTLEKMSRLSTLTYNNVFAGSHIVTY